MIQAYHYKSLSQRHQELQWFLPSTPIRSTLCVFRWRMQEWDSWCLLLLVRLWQTNETPWSHLGTFRGTSCGTHGNDSADVTNASPRDVMYTLVSWYGILCTPSRTSPEITVEYELSSVASVNQSRLVILDLWKKRAENEYTSPNHVLVLGLDLHPINRGNPSWWSLFSFRGQRRLTHLFPYSLELDLTGKIIWKSKNRLNFSNDSLRENL